MDTRPAFTDHRRVATAMTAVVEQLRVERATLMLARTLTAADDYNTVDALSDALAHIDRAFDRLTGELPYVERAADDGWAEPGDVDFADMFTAALNAA